MHGTFGTSALLYLLVLGISLLISTPGFASSYNEHTDRNLQTYGHARRDLLSDLISTLPENLQDDVTQGILQNWWLGIPGDNDAIRNALGIENLDILNSSIEFLNIPGYANYSATDQSWNLRVRGQLYTEPYFQLPQSIQDSLAAVFVPDVNWDDLSPQEQNNARNLTGAVFSVPKEGEQITFYFKWAGESPGGQGGSGRGWEQNTTFPDRTNNVGEIEGFVRLNGDRLPDGNVQGGVVGVVDVWAEGIPTGNATGYLVPEEGITILSDIDDILRVTKIYDPEEGLLNTFARDFTPWLNMPSIFSAWSSSSITSASANSSTPRSPYHFHYLTTTPEQATRRYMNFIYNNYPLGSFDTRPLVFKTAAETFAARRTLLHKIFETFPKRRFVLIGDTTNPDVLKEYPQLASDFPGQVHCILIRNVSSTEPDNHLPYNLGEFQSLKREMYMFFNTPSDLASLDFYRGDCLNTSVRQYVGGRDGFGWRNLPGDGGLDDLLDNLGNTAGTFAVSKRVIGMVVLVVGFSLWWL